MYRERDKGERLGKRAGGMRERDTQREREGERERKKRDKIGREREREGGKIKGGRRENSNSKTLFYKDCSLGSVKNLSNN